MRRTCSSRAGPELVRDLMALRVMYESDGAQPGLFERSPADGGNQGAGKRTVEADLPDPWHGWWLSQGDAAPFERAATDRRSDTRELEGRAPTGPPPRASAPKKARRDVDDEAIYLGGVGAILVHPFLEQLFRERGLLEGRSFRGLEAGDRAVHLIGFVTFGRVDVAEYELVLAKVLCGVELEEPLEPVQLEDDVAACEALVRAVLAHWTALRSSSPEWLREQFFLREGKLEDLDSGRRLTIERHAQDVLLARLPWGCCVVALPWLSERILVHWLE
jgi:Contractile injection system tape measure protein